jgi:hypothetical protein
MTRINTCVLAVAMSASACAASARGSADLVSRPGTEVSPLAARDPQAWRTYVGKLPVGARVRVEVRGGERFTAVLVGLDNDHLLLQPAGRRPEPVRRVRIDTIDRLRLAEHQGLGLAGTTVLTAGTAAATFFGMALILVAMVGDS